ncbi:MAG: tetratricopeptide repeat protein [Planctomycetes bacterium]|nr:tetratricopeptide repeat protein [Planctomycetota bacterium]
MRALTASVERSLAEYQALGANYSDVADQRRARQRLEVNLNASFVALVDRLLVGRVTADHNPESNNAFTLRWKPDERLLLRGRFENLPPRSATASQTAPAPAPGGDGLGEEGDAPTLDPPSDERHALVDFPGLLIELYRDAVQAHEMREIEKAIRHAGKETVMATGRIGELQATRARLHPLLVKPECAAEFDALWREIDTAAEGRHRMDHARRKRGLTSKTDITRLAEARDADADRRARLAGLLRKPQADPERQARAIYDRLVAEMEDLHRFRIATEHRAEEMSKRLAAVRAAGSARKVEEVIGAVREELRVVFANCEYAAKVGNVRPIYVYPEPAGTCALDALRAVLDRIEEFHPGLFDNMRVRRVGRPVFALIPGCGHAISDYPTNRILVPLCHPRSLLESVSSGLLMYLRDVTQHSYNPNERLLLTYQKEINRDFTLKGFAKTHRLLLRDYVKWIEKGSEGLGVFDRETREWFERYIAPDKYSIRVPTDFRDLDLKAINQQVSQINTAGGLGAEEHYVLGVLHALADRLEPALGHFRKCLNLDVDHRFPDAAYNLGVLHRKARQYQQARECFQKYIATGAESWWTRKAQEHIRSLMGLRAEEAAASPPARESPAPDSAQR